jgi:hypothetical protein
MSSIASGIHAGGIGNKCWSLSSLVFGTRFVTHNGWIFRRSSPPGSFFGLSFAVLFPALGRCTVLVCFAGFGSGLTVGAFSSSGRFLNPVAYAITVNLYWIGLGIVSSPYIPALLFYKIIFPGLSRSAQISTHTMVGNLIVLNLFIFIWLGTISGHPAVIRATRMRQQPN